MTKRQVKNLLIHMKQENVCHSALNAESPKCNPVIFMRLTASGAVSLRLWGKPVMTDRMRLAYCG